MKHKSLKILFSALALAGLSPVTASAANSTWTGNATANLGDSGSWSGGTVPVTGDGWVFSSNGTAGLSLSNNLTSSGFQVAGITQNGTATGYTINGGTFTLTGNITNSVGSQLTINSTILVSGNITLNSAFNSGTANIALSGNLTGNGTLNTATTGATARSILISGDNSGFNGTFNVNNSSALRFRIDSANAGSASATWNMNNNVTDGLSLRFGSGTISFGALSGNGQFRQNVAGTSILRIGDLGTNTTFGGTFNQTTNAFIALLKVGAGSLNLTASSSYTGSTTINAGTLEVSGTGAINSTSGITVNGSTAKYLHTSSVASNRTISLTQGTVDGTGTLGIVNVADDATNVITNGNGAFTSLTINTLTFAGNATVNARYVAGTPAIGVTGNLTTTGANGTVLLNVTSAGYTNGFNNIISFGSLVGSISDFTLGTVAGLNARQSAGGLSLNGNNVALSVTGDTPKWTGNGSSQWTTNNSTLNWVLVTGGTSTYFIAGDNVLFDDTASDTSVQISAANVAPATVEFNNTTKNYSVTGNFGISNGSVTKNGNGTTTLAVNNTYTGTTTVNAGTLEVGSGGTSGSIASSASIAVNNSAVLAFNSTNSTTYANVISGNGSVQFNGGTTYLTANNTYAGGTTINNGATMVYGTAALGTMSGSSLGTGAVTVNTGGSVRLGNVSAGANAGLTYTVANTINLNGGSIYAFDGKQVLSGNVSVGSSGGILGSTFNGGVGDGNKGIALTGVVSGSGNLTFQHSRYNTGNIWNSSYVSLSNNANTYNGTITVNQNTTAAEGGSYLGVKGAIALASATLNLNGNILGTAQQLGASPVVFGTGISAYTFGALSGNGNIALTSYNDATHVAGTDSIALTVGGNNASTTYSGVLSNGAVAGGSFAKAGNGILTLTGASTYTGTTLVSAGTLLVNGNNSAATGAVTVASGAILGGNGTIGGNTVVNGTLAPGNSPGLLTFSGSLTLNGTTAMEIAGLTRGVSYDAVDVGTSLAYGGALTINFSSSVSPGDTFNLFDFASQSGDWASIAFTGSYVGSLSGSGGIWTGTVGGQSFEFLNSTGVLSAVPEPSTWLLLSLALTGLVGLRRRRSC